MAVERAMVWALTAVLALGVAHAWLLLQGAPAPKGSTGWQLNNVCQYNLSGEKQQLLVGREGAGVTGSSGCFPSQVRYCFLFITAEPVTSKPAYFLPGNATTADTSAPTAAVLAPGGGGAPTTVALPRTAAAVAMPVAGAGGSASAARPAALAGAAPVGAAGGGAAGGVPAGATLGFQTGKHWGEGT